MPRLFNAPAVAYVAPFAAFVILLALSSVLPIGSALDYPFRVIAVSVVTLLVSRQVITWPPSRPLGSVFLGAAVFAIWIAPDLISSTYRDHWLFTNSLTGTATSSIPPAVRSNSFFLVFRVLGTSILVPIIEELFWRGWLMRYLIVQEFNKIPLGSYSHASFWITAALFATEHGPYWDVGFLTGVIYNFWLVRTRNLADCILAHAVTNACLAVYVIAFDQWRYWL